MKSLNLKSFVAILAIAATSLVSCKKETVAPPPAPEAGVWTGKYGSGGNEPDKYFSFVVNSDGTLQVKKGDPNNPDLGTGTWLIDNQGNFKAVYSYNDAPDYKFSVIAAIDVVNNIIAGEWGIGDQTGDGTFWLKR